MIFSNRYIKSALALLVLAFIPTFFNLYSSEPTLEDKKIDLIQIASERYLNANIPPRRGDKWIQNKFSTQDWTERTYIDSQNDTSARVFAARSFVTKPLLYLPNRTLLGDSWPRKTIASDAVNTDFGSLPVQRVTLKGLGEYRVAMYALFYGVRPVKNPYSFYLSIVPKLLLGRREPMTLIFVDSAVAEGGDTALADDAARSVLMLAAESFVKNAASHE